MTEWVNKKILVTGGTGFLGSYIIRHLLQRGCKHIYGTKRATSRFDLLAGSETRVQWIEADIRDYDAMKIAVDGKHIIIHAAAMVSFVPSDKAALMSINAEATGQLVDLALRNGIGRFIYISSVAALGRTDSDKPIDEKTTWVHSKLNSNYGLSKQKGEREVWRGHAEGLSVAILNPSLIIGSGYWDEGPSNLYQKIYKGLSFYPTGTNGVVDVRDVAMMVMLLLDKEIDGERYISCAENRSHQNLFGSIAKNFGKKPPHRKVTPMIGSLVVWLERIKSKVTGLRPIVTSETLSSSRHAFHYDNSKSIGELGFTYRDVNTSLSDICENYEQSLEKGENYGVLDL